METTNTDGAMYRFDTFRTAALVSDMYYRADDPGPGDRVPRFTLPTVDGGEVASAALGTRPVLLVFGSRTCPVTESAMPRINRLHAEYGDRVRFVLVQTREAHPGERIPQPGTFEEKLQHARRLRDHHEVAFEVAIDDIDGTLHRAFGPKPNSAYLIDPDGTILFRAHWANDEETLRRVIDAVATGRGTARRRSRATVRPLLRAVGHLPGIVRAAGRKVARDVWLAAPPLIVLARLGQLLPGVDADRRGPAVTALLVSSAVAIGIALARSS